MDIIDTICLTVREWNGEMQDAPPNHNMPLYNKENFSLLFCRY